MKTATQRTRKVSYAQKQANKFGFIERAQLIHDFRYDYSKVKYRGSQYKVTIICPRHGEFKQTPGSHLHSSGCPYCSANRPTKAEFVRSVSIIHGEKYDLSLCDYTHTKTMDQEVTLYCEKHKQIFKKRADLLLKGQGCQVCGRENVKPQFGESVPNQSNVNAFKIEVVFNNAGSCHVSGSSQMESDVNNNRIQTPQYDVWTNQRWLTKQTTQVRPEIDLGIHTNGFTSPDVTMPVIEQKLFNGNNRICYC
jgi:hypothetical protein